jgi:heme iron utilization protein
MTDSEPKSSNVISFDASKPSNTASAAFEKAHLPLTERLKLNQDGVLEQLAAEYGVSPLDVVKALPVECWTLAAPSQFQFVLDDVSLWGPVLFLIHTQDLVLECIAQLPKGEFGRGYFNLHGDGPLGGHLKAANCRAIVFVHRPFMGKESRSIQFFNASGHSMFKIFVRRDTDRRLIPEQVAAFDRLRDYIHKA